MRLSQVVDRVIDAIEDRLDNPVQVAMLRVMATSLIQQYGDLELNIEVKVIREVKGEAKAKR